MYWWKELLFVSSYKVCFLFQNFVSCSVSYNINWIVTQVGFFPGPHICSKALTGVGRGITSPFHGDFYFNFHLSWLMCKSWMLQRLEKLICLVRSFSMSCDIFDLHICQDRWKLENWCLLLTQVDCRAVLGLHGHRAIQSSFAGFSYSNASVSRCHGLAPALTHICSCSQHRGNS